VFEGPASPAPLLLRTRAARAPAAACAGPSGPPADYTLRWRSVTRAATAMPEESPRLIAHLDMDAFFASVELLRYPQLRGRPVVVGGGRRREDAAGAMAAEEPRFATLREYVGRGVATTATYEARALGVHSGMGLMKAARLAPDA
jgi:DNA polymerase-4